MKRNIIRFAVLTAILFSSPPLFAAAIPDQLPMIKNAIVLKAYALHRAVGAKMTVGSAGQVPNRAVSIIANKEGGDTADDLVAKLASSPVTFTLASLKDQVNLNVEVYDETHTPLFSGSKQFTFEVGGNGQLRLPSDWGSGNFITLNKQIRIPFPGVQNVEIDFRDRNGKLITNPSLSVSNDGFLFPVDWTERQGELKVTYLDQGKEQTVVYDLHSTVIALKSVLPNWNQNFPVGIEHYWRVSNNSTHINLGGLPKDAVIRLDVTRPPIRTDIWLTLTGGEVPRALIVAYAQPEDPTVLNFSRWPLSADGKYIGLSFEGPAKYFLFLETEVDQFREIHFDYDGGKG